MVKRLRDFFKSSELRGRSSLPETDAEPVDDFSGDLYDLDVASLCNMMQSGRKSGTLALQRDAARGFLYFIAGQIIDARAAQLHGAPAVYQLLRWREGTFRLNFGVPHRPVAMAASTHALLLEGMHRFDEWTRWLTRLPPLESVLYLQPSAVRSVGVDAVADPVLRLVDGQRAIVDILDASPLGDVETAETLMRHLQGGHVATAPVILGAPPPAPPGAHATSQPLAAGQALLPGTAPPPRSGLFYGPATAARAGVPRTPEEAFGLPEVTAPDQRYLDDRDAGGALWRRPLARLFARGKVPERPGPRTPR